MNTYLPEKDISSSTIIPLYLLSYKKEFPHKVHLHVCERSLKEPGIGHGPISFPQRLGPSSPQFQPHHLPVNVCAFGPAFEVIRTSEALVKVDNRRLTHRDFVAHIPRWTGKSLCSNSSMCTATRELACLTCQYPLHHPHHRTTTPEFGLQRSWLGFWGIWIRLQGKFWAIS